MERDILISKFSLMVGVLHEILLIGAGSSAAMRIRVAAGGVIAPKGREGGVRRGGRSTRVPDCRWRTAAGKRTATT